MAKNEVSWKVSKDGKTVSAGGKTYSMKAFKSQFKDISQVNPANTSSRQVSGESMLAAGKYGYAIKTDKTVQQVSAKTADEAKASADKKAAKRAASSLKAANKPSVSANADAARKVAAQRAAKTAPSSRTPAQNLAISRTTGGISGAGAKNVNKIYRPMGGGAGGGLLGNKQR